MSTKIVLAVLLVLLVLLVVLTSKGSGDATAHSAAAAAPKGSETYIKSPGCTCGRAEGNSVVCTCGPVTHSAEKFGDVRFDPADSGRLNALSNSAGSMGTNNVRLAGKSSRPGF